MNPDGTNVEIIGHNYRNSYEQTVTSFGDVFQNDNDDPPACRDELRDGDANAGFASADGKRTWDADKRPGQTTPIAEWRQDDPGTMPSGDVYGGGSPTGVAFYENGALGDTVGWLLSCEGRPQRRLRLPPEAGRRGLQTRAVRFPHDSNKEGIRRLRLLGGRAHRRVEDAVPPLRRRVGPGWRDLCRRLVRRARGRPRHDGQRRSPARSTASRRRASSPWCRSSTSPRPTARSPR